MIQQINDDIHCSAKKKSTMKKFILVTYCTKENNNVLHNFLYEHDF